MLGLAPGSRIFMAVKPVDMRRSFDGLCATITEALGGDPLSGDRRQLELPVNDN